MGGQKEQKILSQNATRSEQKNLEVPRSQMLSVKRLDKSDLLRFWENIEVILKRNYIRDDRRYSTLVEDVCEWVWVWRGLRPGMATIPDHASLTTCRNKRRVRVDLIKAEDSFTLSSWGQSLAN